MLTIKCCAIACKYNSAKLLNNSMPFKFDVSLGNCMYDGEIVLGDAYCQECGEDADVTNCEIFEQKEEIKAMFKEVTLCVRS